MRCFEIIFIFYIIKYIFCLTCDEIWATHSVKKFSLKQMETIPPSELVRCIADLTKHRLTTIESQFIWQTIKKHYNGVQYVPPEALMALHWATTAISPEEYLNITLDDIDVIENFGLDYNLQEDQLAAIAERIRQNFSQKKPEDYTYYDLMALRNILCAFNKEEIERIHPSEYKEAAMMIGKLKHCSGEIFTAFAKLATHKDAFGPPVHWDEDVIKVVGKVLRFVSRKK